MPPPVDPSLRPSLLGGRPAPHRAVGAWFTHGCVALVFAAVGYGLAHSSRAPDPAPLRATPPEAASKRPTQPAGVSAASSRTPAEELRALDDLPPSRRRDAAAADALRRLAVHDPASAVLRLEREPNLVRRRLLRAALLEGWSQSDPDGAIGWAIGLPPSERYGAVNDVLVATASVPPLAVRLASWACEQTPQFAGDIGHALTTALSAAGAFEAAVDFAETRPELRAELLVHAYYEWAVQAPAAALSRVAGLSDPLMREEAFRGVLHGWSTANPGAVADYARHLEPGQRRLALEESLPRWVTHDPVSAAAWLQAHAGGAELDPGRVALATSPQLLGARPQEAVAWALQIAHPEMRVDTARAVLREWSARDAAAARHFAETAAGLDPAQRAALLRAFE